MLVPGRVMESSTLCWGDSELMTSLRVMQHTDMPLFLYFWVYSSFCVARQNSGIKLCLSWPYMKRQSHFWGPLLKSQIPHLLYLKVCPHLRCFLLVSPGLHWIYWQRYPALKRFHDPSQFFGLAWWSVWLIRGSAVLSRGVLQRIEGTRLMFIHQITSTDSGSAAAFTKLHKWAAPCCRVRRISVNGKEELSFLSETISHSTERRGEEREREGKREPCSLD